MKKLITIILILALALPALALAESDGPLYVNKHYTMHLDSHENGFVSGKGGRIFTFDSYTLDLYLMTESTVMLPTITSRKCFALMVSMISQSCLVERAKRDTSKVMMVSPSWACSKREESCSLIAASPCSYSKKICSAPAAFNSRT